MFIITSEFDKLWSDAGNNDEDLRNLQNYLLINPKIGDVIVATAGLRKLRWKLKGKGKRAELEFCI